MTINKIAIIGSGNIGTDLLIKLLREKSNGLEVVALVGIDAASEGLAKARSAGVFTTSQGLEGLMQAPHFDGVDLVYDATSAKSHVKHWEKLKPTGKTVIDLTPAAIGKLVVPSVAPPIPGIDKNINLITCGGQATVPIVAAKSSVGEVIYAEIVSSVSSRSAGPGTRANIDEFTETTANALRVVGGAHSAKAIIVLNPADPPIMMRNTVMCLVQKSKAKETADAIRKTVSQVSSYVPGYRMKHDVQFAELTMNGQKTTIDIDPEKYVQCTVFLEVEGAGDFLPKYAGNLDIMTSAAVAAGKQILGVS